MAGTVEGALRAHLQTWRPYTVCYPGVVGLAGAALAAPHHGSRSLAAAWLAPTLGWIGGHYLGDYFDRHLDAIGKPQRPIPSGRLRAGTALVCGLLCVGAAAAVALLTNWRAALVVVAALGGIVAYSRLLKGRGIAGNLTRGLLTALALLFGTMMAAPFPPWQALPFALAFCLHDTSSNLVGTLRDVAADRAGGYATLPVRYGMRTAAMTAMGCYAMAAATALASTPLVRGAMRADYLALLLLAVGCGTAVFIAVLRSVEKLTPRAALGAHEALVGERIVLGGAVVSSGFGLGPALGVTVPVLAFSLFAQASMRTAYELLPASRPGHEALPTNS